MASETPVSEALALIKQGLSNEEVTRNLEGKGFNLQEISDAINQASIKQGVEGNMPPQNIPEPAMSQEIPVAPSQNQEEIIPAAPVNPQAAVQEAAAYQQQQPYYPPQQAAPSYGDMQAIVEQIVEEKWQTMAKGVGDIGVFKARVGDDMESVKQELLRTQKRLEDLQMAVMGKVKDYHSGVERISSDMKALEKVFGKILEPLTMNIKELGRVTQDLKKKHRKK